MFLLYFFFFVNLIDSPLPKNQLFLWFFYIFSVFCFYWFLLFTVRTFCSPWVSFDFPFLGSGGGSLDFLFETLSSPISVFKTIDFSHSTVWAASHWFWYILSSGSFSSTSCLIETWDFFVYGLLRSMLFHFQMFGGFPVIFPLVISSWCPDWLETCSVWFPDVKPHSVAGIWGMPCLLEIGFYFDVMEMIWKQTEEASHNFAAILNATESCTLRRLILSYVNFMSIYENGSARRWGKKESCLAMI